MPFLNSPNVKIVTPTDLESGYVVSMSPEHHVLHTGGAFSLTKILGNLNSGSSTYIEIISTTDLETATQSYNIVSDQLIKSEFFESPTITDGTTEIPLVQRNRRSSITPLTKVYSDPTNVSGGIFMRELVFGSTIGNTPSTIRPINPTAADALGWNLAKNTKYVIKLTNLSASNATTILYLYMIIFEFQPTP